MSGSSGGAGAMGGAGYAYDVPMMSQDTTEKKETSPK